MSEVPLHCFDGAGLGRTRELWLYHKYSPGWDRRLRRVKMRRIRGQGVRRGAVRKFAVGRIWHNCPCQGENMMVIGDEGEETFWENTHPDEI